MPEHEPSQSPSTTPAGSRGGAEGVRRYRRHAENMRAEHGDEDVAMQQAIGGEFEAMGIMQRDLLRQVGLAPSGFVIDVGCGSGRLALPLSRYLTGGYLGTDVVPDLLAYAEALVGRPDWRFQLSEGSNIPAPDGVADAVCFFSVFTHLTHEETYQYLTEAKRVLKPEGRIVFSFLEFGIYSHWSVFELNLASMGTELHLNQFMSRDGIDAWAHHLGLRVVTYLNGDEQNIELYEPAVLERGVRYEDKGALGQSVAVLEIDR